MPHPLEWQPASIAQLEQCKITLEKVTVIYARSENINLYLGKLHALFVDQGNIQHWQEVQSAWIVEGAHLSMLELVAAVHVWRTLHLTML